MMPHCQVRDGEPPVSHYFLRATQGSGAGRGDPAAHPHPVCALTNTRCWGGAGTQLPMECRCTTALSSP